MARTIVMSEKTWRNSNQEVRKEFTKKTNKNHINVRIIKTKADPVLERISYEEMNKKGLLGRYAYMRKYDLTACDDEQLFECRIKK